MKYLAEARAVCPWHHANSFCVHCEAIAAAMQKAVEEALSRFTLRHQTLRSGGPA